MVIAPDSFSYTDHPGLPVWRWFTAPVEVFFSADGVTIAGVIVFILLVGVAFAVMERSGILNFALAAIVRRFGEKKYPAACADFFFMVSGRVFGLLEESGAPGADYDRAGVFPGLGFAHRAGMSALATNVGFSMAVFNCFTIGCAATGWLPLFSGWARAWFCFSLYMRFWRYFLTMQSGCGCRRSPVFLEDREEKPRLTADQDLVADRDDPRLKRAAIFMAACFGLGLVLVMLFSWIEGLNALAMPLSGLLFLVGGVGAGLIAGIGKGGWKAAWEGFLGIAPAIPLLMMAASIKLIISSGGILDTMLYVASGRFSGTSPLVSALLIYAVTLVLELFVSSGSAKALMVIPLIMPLADLVGVNRQIAVTRMPLETASRTWFTRPMPCC